MSFFDFQGSETSKQVVTQLKGDPSIPHSGDIAIRITDSLFENLVLSDKQRLFTTQDIKQRAIIIVIENTTFRGNSLEKGFQFDFKHNFRQTTFVDCRIEGNNGYFLEADPSDQRNQTLVQHLTFIRLLVRNNTGRNYGMFHIRKNAQADFINCTFEDNASFGRGVIIYSEMDGSVTTVKNSTFKRNFGY